MGESVGFQLAFMEAGSTADAYIWWYCFAEGGKAWKTTSLGVTWPAGFTYGEFEHRGIACREGSMDGMGGCVAGCSACW